MEEQIRRHDRPAPRYTSYPTTPHFTPDRLENHAAIQRAGLMRIAWLLLSLLAVALLSGQPLLVGSPARADGDSSAGRKVFKQCRNCHSVRAGKFGTFGSNLYQVIGHMAGTAPDYDYSPALAGAGFTWTPELLDRWLADPPAFLPGTEMEFILESAEERADVIAYLIAAGKR